MTEDYLSKLTLDELLELMVKAVNEILSLPRNERGRKLIAEKNREIQLLQKVIKEKQLKKH